jgi:cysteinyl-tRNA synthetase
MKTMRLFDTMLREKVEFEPAEPGHVKMYVCGVTPYNLCHLGHARAYITFDLLKRCFLFQGWTVTHVQNFTDIDDKIINAAAVAGETAAQVSQKYIAAYYEDMEKLHVQPADVYPLVTENMAEIIQMVETLIEKGHAYESEGDVYFSVASFPEYGKLSGRKDEDMMAGARVDINEKKQAPMDFALWKKAKPGEPMWSSPWGEGRPGWHIECSALSYKHLGIGFDIHGGGADLVFPHHENEIAQSEAFAGCGPFARYWVHNGFVTINEEKMSKSLGNFFTIRDILTKYEPEVLRFLLLSTHYRSPLEFSPDKLDEAGRALQRIRNAYYNLQQMHGQCGEQPDASWQASLDGYRQDFRAALMDDFNSAKAIGVLFDFVREINSLGGENPTGMASIALDGVKFFEECDQVLAVLDGAASSNGEAGMADALLELLMQVRDMAREKKDYATSDIIRDGLAALDVIVEDTKSGSRWKKA